MDFSGRIMNWGAALWKTRYLLLFALLFAIIALFVNSYASHYVDRVSDSVRVPDLILDNLGPINLSVIFVWFIIFIVVLFYLYPLIFEPEKFYYYVSMAALFMIIRGLFITLTHVRQPFDAIVVHYPALFSGFSFFNDMFFSGHTGFPFLGFLVFKSPVRYLFLLSAFALGISSLLMHEHYSIDVFAAFFITYGIYKIGNMVSDK